MLLYIKSQFLRFNTINTVGLIKELSGITKRVGQSGKLVGYLGMNKDERQTKLVGIHESEYDVTNITICIYIMEVLFFSSPVFLTLLSDFLKLWTNNV